MINATKISGRNRNGTGLVTLARHPDRPGLGHEILRVAMRIVLAGAELVEIVVARDLVPGVGLRLSGRPRHAAGIVDRLDGSQVAEFQVHPAVVFILGSRIMNLSHNLAGGATADKLSGHDRRNSCAFKKKPM